jgi:hypothetical protein
MPKFAKGSKEAKEYMASIRAKRGGAKGKGIEGGGKKFDFFDDLIIPVGKKSGDPFKKSVGVNPFEAGFKFGRDTVAPALMKVIPPPKKGRGMRGGMMPGGGAPPPQPPPPQSARDKVVNDPYLFNEIFEYVGTPQPPPISPKKGRSRKTLGKGMSPASIPPAPAPANRDLTPEMVGGGMGEMEYCPCSHCGGMGIKKKTRM